MTAPTVDET